MARPGEHPSPLFSFTAYSAFAGLSVGVALLLIWSVWVFSPSALSLRPPDALLTVSVLLFDLVLLGLGSVGLLLRVWNMRFFEEAFTVRARGVSASFAYTQLKDVHLYIVSSGLQRRQVLRIQVLDEEPFTITGNPRNKVLNTDLHSWLRNKMEGDESARGTSEAPPKATQPTS